MPGPPRKPLEELIREGTFRSSRQAHRELLAGARVSFPAFAKIQDEYARADSEFDRRKAALKFQAAVRQAFALAQQAGAGPTLEQVMASLGPPGSSDSVVNFFPRFLTHEDGSAFVLEPWQEEFVRELSLRADLSRRRDKSTANAGDGELRADIGARRVYKEVLLGLPRGGGKTPLASGLALYALCSAPGRPKVFQAAGSKEQAAIGTEFARGWIDDGQLSTWLKASARTITRKDGRGLYTVMSSDGRLGHGRRPTVGVIDELWLFHSRAEVQTYVAIQSALHKLEDAYLIAISTAGYDKASQLGGMYERALKLPDVEHRREGFLRIARDREAGLLLWWCGMPEGYELDLADDEAVVRALRLANPGSWVDVDEMLRMLRRGMDEREWRRLCLNAWTSARDVWLPSGCWASLKEPEGFEVPAGAPVFVGVDAAWKHDCAAVVWAYPYEQDGRPKVAIRSRIWSNRHDVPHDQYVPGSELRLQLLGDFIAEGLGRRYDVREIVFDPQMFLGEAQRLDDRGFAVAPLHQASAHMVEAVQGFYTACREGTLSHAGDAILAAHVEATAADLTPSGWRIRKLKSSQPIDGAVAAVIAHWRAERYQPQHSIYETHDLFVIGADDEDDDWIDESRSFDE